MRTHSPLVVIAIAAAMAATYPASARAATLEPRAIIDRACAAAGGLEAFRSIPILQMGVTINEVTADGHTSTSTQHIYFRPPGPTPGRLEYESANVVIGDDGTGGWAIAGGAPDSRPGTAYLVKRSLSTTLFPALMPFSLRWDGVAVTGVSATDLNGTPVWRLAVTLPKGFFASPQIATNWTVDIDQVKYTVLRAESPYTDLGRGILADGMRFSWFNPVRVAGITLPGEQHIVGLDARGAERSHSRIDRFTYSVLPASKAVPLFANPVPPDQRPKPQVGPEAVTPKKP